MEPSIYKTKDIYESAAILAKGQRLLRLNPKDDHFLFVFEGKERSEKIADAFWAGLDVNGTKAYADALRTLKDRLFARRQR